MRAPTFAWGPVAPLGFWSSTPTPECCTQLTPLLLPTTCCSTTPLATKVDVLPVTGHAVTQHQWAGFVELLLRTAMARHHAARAARTVRVAYDPVHGYGLQAARDIAAGELVIKYELVGYTCR